MSEEDFKKLFPDKACPFCKETAHHEKGGDGKIYLVCDACGAAGQLVGAGSGAQ